MPSLPPTCHCSKDIIQWCCVQLTYDEILFETATSLPLALLMARGLGCLRHSQINSLYQRIYTGRDATKAPFTAIMSQQALSLRKRMGFAKGEAFSVLPLSDGKIITHPPVTMLKRLSLSCDEVADCNTTDCSVCSPETSYPAERPCFIVGSGCTDWTQVFWGWYSPPTRWVSQKFNNEYRPIKCTLFHFSSSFHNELHT